MKGNGIMKQQTRKRIIIILLACVSVFALYCVVWAVYVSRVYSPFIKGLDGAKTVESDGYFYYVATPSFLSFTGNLAVAESRKDKDVFEDSSVDLIIWPQMNGEYKVLVQVETPKERVDEYNTKSAMYGFYLNSDLKPDLTDEETIQSYYEHKEFFEENWDKIENALDKARATFDLSIG